MKSEINSFKKTALCYWRNGSYIVYSPLLAFCAGEGTTREEAWKSFNDLLDEYVQEAQHFPASTVMNFSGANLEETLSLPVFNYINKLADQFGCSRADVLTYLVEYHRVAVLPAEGESSRPQSGKAN